MVPKILIIEDHPAIRSMLVSLFHNHSYQTDEAGDGVIGLEKAIVGGYAAILLDLKLPEVDGLQILRKLHQVPPTLPNGPIVVFSSHEHDSAIKEAFHYGAADFIVKDDLDTSHLIERVEKVIAAHPKPAFTN